MSQTSQQPSVTTQDFIKNLRSHLGTRWQHQGRLPGVCLDCAGLVVIAARQSGARIVLDKSAYDRRPDPHLLLQCIEGSGLTLVPMHALEVGDLLVMRYDSNPQHLAIITEIKEGAPPRIIHAAATARAVVEHYLTDDWRGRVAHVFRFPFAASE